MKTLVRSLALATTCCATIWLAGCGEDNSANMMKDAGGAPIQTGTAPADAPKSQQDYNERAKKGAFSTNPMQGKSYPKPN